MASTVITEGNIKTFQSGANLNGKKNFIVKLDSGTNKVVLNASATTISLGVIENDPKNAKDSVSVRLMNANGTGKVIAGGSIAKGAYLTSDSAGKAVATTTSGNFVFGIALRAADAGDIVEFMPIGLHILA